MVLQRQKLCIKELLTEDVLFANFLIVKLNGALLDGVAESVEACKPSLCLGSFLALIAFYLELRK